MPSSTTRAVGCAVNAIDTAALETQRSRDL